MEKKYQFFISSTYEDLFCDLGEGQDTLSNSMYCSNRLMPVELNVHPYRFLSLSVVESWIREKITALLLALLQTGNFPVNDNCLNTALGPVVAQLLV